jgi:uncharacterized membrane protein (DUF485 family)
MNLRFSAFAQLEALIIFVHPVSLLRMAHYLNFIFSEVHSRTMHIRNVGGGTASSLPVAIINLIVTFILGATWEWPAKNYKARVYSCYRDDTGANEGIGLGEQFDHLKCNEV